MQEHPKFWLSSLAGYQYTTIPKKTTFFLEDCACPAENDITEGTIGLRNFISKDRPHQSTYTTGGIVCNTKNNVVAEITQGDWVDSCNDVRIFEHYFISTSRTNIDEQSQQTFLVFFLSLEKP